MRETREVIRRLYLSPLTHRKRLISHSEGLHCYVVHLPQAIVNDDGTGVLGAAHRAGVRRLEGANDADIAEEVPTRSRHLLLVFVCPIKKNN